MLARQALYLLLEPFDQPCFVMGFFKIGTCKLFAWSWLQTSILLITRLTLLFYWSFSVSPKCHLHRVGVNFVNSIHCWAWHCSWHTNVFHPVSEVTRIEQRLVLPMAWKPLSFTSIKEKHLTI
jgi:hypothetical protein